MKVDLFYLSPNTYGGWVTHTVQLAYAFSKVGVEVELFKIRPKSEKKQRPFGFDTFYRNISMEEALSRNNPKLIVAAAKKFKQETFDLYINGASLIVHDPTELKNLPSNLDHSRCIVIRKVALKTMPTATFIRHPFKLMLSAPQLLIHKTQVAVSNSRIDFDKHTELILDANRLITKPDNKVQIWGFENRIYTRFKIVPKYPEWEQSKVAYKRESMAAIDILKPARYSVDMTEIKGDGGGTQYTFLEAWNTLTVPIINKAWILDEPDDMIPNENCLVVGSGEELAEMLNDWESLPYKELADNGFNRLVEHHNPEKIGEQYKEFIIEQWFDN